MAYHTVIVLCSLTQEGPITWSFAFRPYELIGLIFVFDNYRELTFHPYSRLIRLFINTAIVFGVINITLYYLPLPIWNRVFFWWGRISCGYPTMDVISLSYALVFLLHYKNLGWSTPRVMLYAGLLSIFIILNFSGSGSLLLLLILFLSVFFRHSRKAAGRVLIVGCLIFAFGLMSLQQYFPREYSQGKTLLETKLKNLIGDNSADTNTLEDRDKQFAKAQRRVENSLVEILGIGINYATNDSEMLRRYKDSYMIENEYNLLRVCYGLVGLVVFIIFIIHMTLTALNFRNIVGLMGGGVFAVNSFTLIPFVLYPNVVLLAFVYVLITTNENPPKRFLIVKTKLGNMAFILKVPKGLKTFFKR